MKPLSAREIERLVLQHGWVRKPGGDGSHRTYVKAGERFHVTIPFHAGDLAPGTQLSIMRIAGISRDEL